MRILVVGCGSIGRRHIRLLREMGAEVLGFDTRTVLERVAAEFLHIKTFTKLDDAMGEEPQGAIIATPTHLHAGAIARVMSRHDPRGLLTISGVMVEKPIAHTVEQAEHIVATMRRYGPRCVVPLLVGYCLRWHPGLQRLKHLLDSGAIGKPLHASIHFGHYLPDWHPGEDYRRWYSAHRDQGGGVLSDASHELDYVCWLLGEPVSVSAAVQNTGALEIDCEDVADVILQFVNGVQANIHLDYLDRRRQRWCRVIGTDGTASCDLTLPSALVPVEQQNNCPGGYALKKFEPDDMYRAELRHFLAVCRGEEQPLVTGADGLRVVRIVEAAQESSKTGRVVVL